MFEQTPEQRAERLAKAIEYAGGYVPRDPSVLQRLRDAVQRPLPPTATHAELAYQEGQRALVEMIIRQYQLATTGSADTPWTPPQTMPPQAEPQTHTPAKAPRRRRVT
jgi:hypothetical protein